MEIVREKERKNLQANHSLLYCVHCLLIIFSTRAPRSARFASSEALLSSGEGKRKGRKKRKNETENNFEDHSNSDEVAASDSFASRSDEQIGTRPEYLQRMEFFFEFPPTHTFSSGLPCPYREYLAPELQETRAESIRFPLPDSDLRFGFESLDSHNNCSSNSKSFKPVSSCSWSRHSVGSTDTCSSMLKNEELAAFEALEKVKQSPAAFTHIEVAIDEELVNSFLIGDYVTILGAIKYRQNLQTGGNWLIRAHSAIKIRADERESFLSRAPFPISIPPSLPDSVPMVRARFFLDPLRAALLDDQIEWGCDYSIWVITHFLIEFAFSCIAPPGSYRKLKLQMLLSLVSDDAPLEVTGANFAEAALAVKQELLDQSALSELQRSNSAISLDGASGSSVFGSSHLEERQLIEEIHRATGNISLLLISNDFTALRLLYHAARIHPHLHCFRSLESLQSTNELSAAVGALHQSALILTQPGQPVAYSRASEHSIFSSSEYRSLAHPQTGIKQSSTFWLQTPPQLGSKPSGRARMNPNVPINRESYELDEKEEKLSIQFDCVTYIHGVSANQKAKLYRNMQFLGISEAEKAELGRFSADERSRTHETLGNSSSVSVYAETLRLASLSFLDSDISSNDLNMETLNSFEELQQFVELCSNSNNLRDYLVVARSIPVEFHRDAANFIQEYFLSARIYHSTYGIQELYSLIRFARAHARLCLKKQIDRMDVAVAILMLEESHTIRSSMMTRDSRSINRHCSLINWEIQSDGGLYLDQDARFQAKKSNCMEVFRIFIHTIRDAIEKYRPVADPSQRTR
jgi:hypothetical protein